jgi:hypothetical protein
VTAPITAPVASRKKTVIVLTSLAIVLVGVVALVFWAVGAHNKMTAETAATVTKVEESSPIVGNVETTHDVSYSYIVDGKTYTGSSDAPWYSATTPAKVCYDPSDPKSSTLQEASTPCPK